MNGQMKEIAYERAERVDVVGEDEVQGETIGGREREEWADATARRKAEH